MGHIYGYEGDFKDIYDGSALELEVLAKPNLVGEMTERNETLRPGEMFFDKTLNKPIWRTISGWVDATGESV